MITAILTPKDAIAKVFVRELGLEKLPEAPHGSEATYRKGDTILVVSKDIGAAAAIRSKYLPERLYYANFWTSATSERYAGDVVLPNAFIPHGELSGTDGAAFLENYEEQEDYDFETFGLSVGGVCVSAEGEISDETLVEIASEYGADIVDEEWTAVMFAAEGGEDASTYPIYGVVWGIVGNETENVSEETVAKNVFAIFRYLEDTFSDEDRSPTDGDELTDDVHDEQT